MARQKYDFINSPGGRLERRGAPPKYDPDFCEDMIEFFSVEPYTIREHISFNKFGQKSVTYSEKPNTTPHFIDFATKIGVHRDTLNEWARTHEEFNRAYKQCRELQRNFLIENALRGNFNATAYIFTAKNLTEMRDKVEVESKNATTVSMSQSDARKAADKLRKQLKE